MANNDAPFGFNPIGKLGGGTSPAMNSYKALANYATEMFQGDIVKIDEAEGDVQLFAIAGGGTDATVAVVMNFGYGFIKHPTGDSATQFQFLFTEDNFTMGTITSLTRINPGTDYNLDPFISVHNKYIAAYDRKNIYLNITLVTSNFTPGEII